MEKKRIFSGIQPTGSMTLGNYIGAIKNWVSMQDDYECIYSIVDLHSLTVRQTGAELRKNSLELMAMLLACGIDTQKSLLFFQSHVPQHSELAWVLMCNTQMGELSRMTQFKDKSKKNKENINAGLFSYPSLMAADILLYNAHLVPVGHDQTQHLELTRDIAMRFNGAYSETFVIPEGYIPKVGARVMSLQEPTNKMSKSDANVNSYILLNDDKDTIIRKFKKAVTDSENKIIVGKGKDGINNLIGIYSAVTGNDIKDIEKQFDCCGYGEFKLAVGETVADHLAPIQKRYKEFLDDKNILKETYTKSAEVAQKIANRTLSKVYKKIGLVIKE